MVLQTAQKMLYEDFFRERKQAQLYLDIAGVMFVALNEAGEIILINRKGCEILGYRDKELLGRNWFDVCLPKSVVPVVKEVFARQMAGEINTYEFFENPIINRDGNERIIAFHNTLLRDDSGRISGVLFSGEDVTESREALKYLERASNEWQAAMDASDDAIYLLSLERKLLRANKAFFHMIGLAPKNAVGRHISEVIHPHHSGQCILCQAEEEKRDFIAVLETDHPDNHVGQPIEVNIKIVRDSGGEPLSILVSHHDLTFDRKSQEAMREMEERYRQLIEFSQDIIFIQSEGRVIFMNDTGVRMFAAASPSELLSRPVLDLVHPDSRELALSRMEAAKAKTGKLPVEEVKFLRLDGTSFFGEVNANSIMHHGKPAVHLFVRDITVRKTLENQLRQSQKMEAVGHLAGGIAHDFNNILTVIGGYGSLLQMDMAPDDPNREKVDQILASTERAANLTRGLLAFSRKQEMVPQNLNLNGIIQDVGKLLIRVIGEDIALSTTIKNDPINVFVDRGQIEQVLMNLATNARDVMEDGGTFTIETQITEINDLFIQTHGYVDPGNYALITVSDDGKGMDEATKNKIFEPFFTTKEVGKGTGLGLAIVYGVVRQHNGHITVRSKPGEGTSFRIYLPLAEGMPPKENEKDSPEHNVTGTETVLVVEDEAPVLKLVESILKQYGYDVIPAENGQDGFDKFLTNRDSISLVFTDLIMPKKSGMELIKEVRAISPEMKFLITSGYTADKLEKKGNMEEYEIIMKPVSPLELVRKIRETLDAPNKHAP